jgi:hypothetical protein
VLARLSQETIWTEVSVRERVAIFIDGSNLYNGMRENLRSTRVNLAELIKQLAAGASWCAATTSTRR